MKWKKWFRWARLLQLPTLRRALHSLIWDIRFSLINNNLWYPDRLSPLYYRFYITCPPRPLLAGVLSGLLETQPPRPEVLRTPTGQAELSTFRLHVFFYFSVNTNYTALFIFSINLRWQSCLYFFFLIFNWRVIALNTVLASATDQHEAAPGTPMSPSPWTRLLP